MITVKQYFWQKDGSPECTPAICEAADALLLKVNALLESAAQLSGWVEKNDPDTWSPISGAKGGAGDGGFRLSTTTTGATHSAHRFARAVDVYDPEGKLDDWLSGFDEDGGRRNAMLEEFGLYREAPGATRTWCHLQDLAPGSGRRTFSP